jgi:hypothetical protein
MNSVMRDVKELESLKYFEQMPLLITHYA